MGNWLDEDGRLKKGYFKEEDLGLVCSEDPKYLEWLLTLDGLEAEERELIEEALQNA